MIVEDQLPFRVPEPARPITPGPVPTFSVVIAAYNVAPWIAEAVRSALEQKVMPLEVIVCDDGSSDDLAGALEPFAGDIVLLRQENRGVSAARNTAVRAASGDFVVILDGDDVDLPERIEALGLLASMRPDLDILSTDAWLTVDGIPHRRYHHAGHPFETVDQRRRILERNFIVCPAVRRSAWAAVGEMDVTLRTGGADWELWQRIILAGGPAGLVDLPLTMYRQRSDSITHQRIPLFVSRCRILEASLRRDDLLPHERRAVIDELRTARRRLVEECARHRARPPVRDAFAVVRDGRQPSGSRARAAASVVSPRLLAVAQRA